MRPYNGKNSTMMVIMWMIMTMVSNLISWWWWPGFWSESCPEPGNFAGTGQPSHQTIPTPATDDINFYIFKTVHKRSEITLNTRICMCNKKLNMYTVQVHVLKDISDISLNNVRSFTTFNMYFLRALGNIRARSRPKSVNEYSSETLVLTWWWQWWWDHSWLTSLSFSSLSGPAAGPPHMMGYTQSPKA